MFNAPHSERASLSPLAYARRPVATASAVLLSVVGGALLVLPPYILPFAIVALIVVAIAMFQVPLMLLLIYLLFAVGFVQEWVPFFFSLPHLAERIVAYCVIGAVLLQSVKARALSFRLTPVGKGLLVVVLAFGTTVITAYWVQAWSNAMYELLRHLVLFVAVANIVTTPRRVRLVTFFYIGTVAVLTIMSIKYYYEGHRIYRMGIWRAVGPGASLSDPNAHAATILYMMPMIIGVWSWSRRRWFRAGLVALAMACTWNIVITGSRTAAVGFLAMLGFYVVRWKRRMFGLAGATVFVAVLLTTIPAQYLGRLESSLDTSGTSGASQSALGRWHGLLDGVSMFSSSPITGVGFGCYTVVHGQRFGQWFASHSLPGQLLGETGLVGSFGFLVFLVAFWRQARGIHSLARASSLQEHKYLPSLVEALLVSLGLLLLMGLGGHNLSRYNWFLLSGILASVRAVHANQGTAATQPKSPWLVTLEPAPRTALPLPGRTNGRERPQHS